MSDKKTILSFEVFPPKKEAEFENAFATMDKLAALKPAFISVTYGAGGSRSKKTVEISDYIQNKLGITALAHLTCVGNKKEDIDEVCRQLAGANIQNVLALRGDRPQDMDDATYESRDFVYASELVAHLKATTDFTLYGACYPEKHFEAMSTRADLQHLKEKVEAGATELITQLFMNNDVFYDFQDKCLANGINVPIHAGIMPITSAKQVATTISLSGTSIPKAFSDLVARYGDNADDMRKAGIDYAIRQMQDLIDGGVDGVHIYSMNKPKMTEEIVSALRF